MICAGDWDTAFISGRFESRFVLTPSIIGIVRNMLLTETPLINRVISGGEAGQVISFQVDVVFIVVRRMPG
jgi:hypothetical protein